MGDLQPCPYCSEPIQPGARICRHCKSSLEAPPPRAMRPVGPRRSGGPSAIVIVAAVLGALVIAAIVVAIALPALQGSNRGSNERNAAASLKTLATAEADFRSNDRDSNRINDFWTADVAGLYAIDTSYAIKLIDLSVALADQDPRPQSLSNGNYSTSITSLGVQSAKSGYWYRMLDKDLQVAVARGDPAYRQDTDGSGDKVHHTSRFGVCAMPESYGSSGTRVFIINEGNTMFARDFGIDVLNPQFPPSLSGNFDANWPRNSDLSSQWSKLD